MADVIGELLHTPLFDQAEAVRWRMADIPWERIDPEVAPTELRALVRGIAFSELTTFSATRRFLTELADDVDLTQWIAVWFYEESKHPHVLLRWLHQLGETVDEQFVLKGRATAPFMRSRMGTLVTNIISEMVASAGYTLLAERSPEPVLAQIAQHLAGDEARHAASFYRFAQRQLARAAEPEVERRDALKVLYMWFQSNELVTHPVNEFHQRIGFDVGVVRERVTRVIGTLIGVDLGSGADVVDELRRRSA